MSGSFVKNAPGKVDFGQPLVAALRDLYATPDKERTGLFVESVTKQTIKIETVGFEKIEQQQSRLDELVMVQLKQCEVSTVGNPGELQSLAPSKPSFTRLSDRLPLTHVPP